MTEVGETFHPSDQTDGPPHPSETQTLFGQQKACKQFLDAFSAGRLHHAWLITGLRGIGKATLAWQIAKFLLTIPDQREDAGLLGITETPTDLRVPNHHPIAQRIKARSEPGLLSIQRTYDEKRKRFKQIITVDEIRKVNSFFNLSAVNGGRRIVIVDSAEDMNRNASNALLKALEEPPKNAFLFLISHHPARLLPTIRSRCCELHLETLNHSNMSNALRATGIDLEVFDLEALLELSGGSVGAALRLINQDGLFIYQLILEILATLPNLDHNKVTSISEKFSGKEWAAKFDFFCSLLDMALKRLTLNAIKRNKTKTVTVLNEDIIFSRICPDQRAAIEWATVTQDISIRLRQGHAVNLDPAALILDTFFKIEECANKTAQ